MQVTPLFIWQEGNKWTNYMNMIMTLEAPQCRRSILDKYDHSGSAYKQIFTAFDVLYKSI